MRLQHLSHKTERVYVSYMRDFILFHDKRHPQKMDVDEIQQYLTYLAVRKNVAASTQNVAFNAILFLYKQVLEINLPLIDGVLRAKKPKHLPVVFTPTVLQRTCSKINTTFAPFRNFPDPKTCERHRFIRTF